MNRLSVIKMAFLLLGAGTLSFCKAQTISAEQIFPVTGYSVFERGYPLQLLPAPGQFFHFMEFWIGGNEGRQTTNYYLQTYAAFDYGEKNFTPVTPLQVEPMRVKSALNTYQQGVAIIGTQELGPDQETHTIATFFDSKGDTLSGEPVQLSHYEKSRRRNYEEWIRVSPLGKYLLWVGKNGRDYYASLFNYGGKEIWREELDLPYLRDGYKVGDVSLDDRGQPYILMTPAPDKAGVPIMLLQLTDSARSTLAEPISPGNQANILRATLTLTEDSNLIVTGVLNQPMDSTRLINGTNLENEEVWTSLFIAHYEQRTAENQPFQKNYIQSHPIPQHWINHFQEEGGPGSDFSDLQIVLHDETLVMIFEEQYNRKDLWLFYDMGLFAFDLNNGQKRWSKIIAKKQRNRGTNEVLSYVSGVSRDKLRLVFLTERGAQGKLNCTSIDLETGERKDRYLASNETAQYLFFPKRSAMISDRDMVLLGLGNPGQNDYKLITITF